MSPTSTDALWRCSACGWSGTADEVIDHALEIKHLIFVRLIDLHAPPPPAKAA